MNGFSYKKINREPGDKYFANGKGTKWCREGSECGIHEEKEGKRNKKQDV